MNTSAFILEAGGLVPVAQPVDGVSTDVVSARSYTHPALGDRAVVRLSPSALAEANDLEMEVLGFNSGTHLGDVGRQKRRALGFPGWCLVHDPPHARYALKVVKRFQKAARRVKSKPGFAKEDFDKLATELSSAVPHFLPSYFEEAGRAYLAHGNQKYAGQMFEKARDAERVYGLQVDEDLRRESFLEFALAGGVAIKSMSNYARDLGTAADPLTAYQQFRKLCVGRTLGGLPPWAGMSTALRKLAKRAGLDKATEDRRLIDELIEAPALKKAARGFWKDYSKAIAAACAEQPALRSYLLDLFPESGGWRNKLQADWLGWLEDWGCVDFLTGEVPEAAQPSGGTAAWLGRVLDYVWRWRGASDAQVRLMSWVVRGVPKLKAGGASVRVTNAHSWVHLDLADLALSHGLTVSFSNQARLNLSHWVGSSGLEGCGRDPVHAVRHPQLSALLANATGASIGDGDFDRLSAGMEGFVEAKRTWLSGRLDTLETGGVGSLRLGVKELVAKLTPGLLSDCGPEFYERLVGVRAVRALEISLREGIPDELGWPAIEAAVTELGDTSFETFACFPTVVLANRIRAIAVGPDGILAREDLQLPAKHQLDLVRFVDGRFLVLATDRTTYKRYGFWAGIPGSRFEHTNYIHNQAHVHGYIAESGLVVAGVRGVSVGDTSWPPPTHLLSDGHTAWRPVPKPPHGREWVEFDPRTGEKGRPSLPAFLEDFGREGSAVHVGRSRLLPWTGDSPLGARAGLVGWRVRERDPEHPLGASRPAAEAEGIDGRTCVADSVAELPWGLLSLPGRASPLRVHHSRGWRGMGTTTFHTESGSVSAHIGRSELRMESFGQALVLPAIFLHAYTPRDPSASRAMRTLDAARVQGWFDAAHTTASGPDPSLTNTVKAAMAAVDLTDNRRLQRGIAGLTTLAAIAQTQLDHLVASMRPSDGPVVDVSLLSDDLAKDGLAGFVDTVWSRDGHLGNAILATAAALESGAGTSQALDTSVLWWSLLGRERALAVIASLDTTPDARRQVLLQLLELLSSTPFSGTTRTGFRLLYGTVDRALLRSMASRPVVAHNGSVFVVKTTTSYHHGDPLPVRVLEKVGPNGPQVPPFLTLTATRTFHDTWGSAADIAELRTALSHHGPVGVPDPTPFITHTGRPRAEARLVLAGLPYIQKYENNFLPKDLRTRLELKVAEAKTARGPLKKLTVDQRLALFAGGFQQLHQVFDGSWVQGVADAWVAAFGRSIALDEATLAAVPSATAKALGTGVREGLEMFLAPDSTSSLHTDPNPGLTPKGLDLGTSSSTFSSTVLKRVAELLPWVCTALPADDPIRQGAAKVLELTRARLGSGRFFVSLGRRYVYGEPNADDTFEAIGGELLEGGSVRDRGLWLVTKNNRTLHYYFRPDRIQSPDDLHTLRQLHTNAHDRGLQHTLLVLSENYDRLAQPSATAPGHHDADPRQSNPVLVARVMDRLNVSEDAATLYLQTLALVDCTTKNVRMWNGWTAARYKKASAELATKDGLALEAKRARAGRKLFVPGGWLAQRAPNLPLERWKMPLYSLQIPEGTTQATGPLATFLPLLPLAEHFQAALDRVEAGDGPRYEEV